MNQLWRQRFGIGVLSTALGMVALNAGAGESPRLEQQWETDGLRTPESVLYHESDGEAYLLVAEIEGEGSQADGKGGIAKLSLDGEVIDRDWARGMNAPKGMGILRNTLYVADLTEVLAVSLKTGQIMSRIPVADSVFLNDIAIDDGGTVYVSDTRTGKVHRILSDGAELFLDGLKDPNGLYIDGDAIYIGAGNTLLRANPEGELETVAEGFESGIDGVEKIGTNEFLVTCWVGLVYHVRDGKVTRLMDTRDPRMNTADLGWNPDDGIAYIPTFFTDSVIAYRWH
ncbi:GTP-binding protein [Marinimicrobium sp. C6131]|uniref:GTP-binding protein n=1 Tax=Marinimicrobium sp. C6131 TaxID=3022676 RepID=UPI00223CF667|nr:GTP-binding protein [Marinimicrobium sp. C6131]UZJ44295.1 GTP-binding protein [Marinimicrobium sp. C6131]